MFSHVRVATNDVEKARRFYDAALGALRIAPGQEKFGMFFYSNGTDRFAVGRPREGNAIYANGLTIGFKAASEQAVDAFHAAGLANGGTDEGKPGLRHNTYYAAYLRDPDGNKVCAMLLQ